MPPMMSWMLVLMALANQRRESLNPARRKPPMRLQNCAIIADLLFYHRLLQCMVAIELKITEFHSKDLGQLEFYLEALDQEERRSNKNPSIGILLCKKANQEVVRFALNRSMSPTMVAQYKEQLQVGGVIQRSLVEFCKFVEESKKTKE